MYVNTRILATYVYNSVSKKKKQFTGLYELPWDDADISTEKPKKKIAISQIPSLFPDEIKM